MVTNIRDRCPTCGHATLELVDGWLVCRTHGCRQPNVAAAMVDQAAVLTTLTAERDSARRASKTLARQMDELRVGTALGVSELRETIEQLRTENGRLRAECDALTGKVDALGTELTTAQHQLGGEADRLRGIEVTLRGELEELQRGEQVLREAIGRLPRYTLTGDSLHLVLVQLDAVRALLR